MPNIEVHDEPFFFSQQVTFACFVPKVLALVAPRKEIRTDVDTMRLGSTIDAWDCHLLDVDSGLGLLDDAFSCVLVFELTAVAADLPSLGKADGTGSVAFFPVDPLVDHRLSACQSKPERHKVSFSGSAGVEIICTGSLGLPGPATSFIFTSAALLILTRTAPA